MVWGLSVFALVHWSCSNQAETSQDITDENPQKSESKLVKVRPVTAAPPRGEVEYVGVLSAHRKVNVSSEMGGTVERIHFEKGDRVKKGQLLCEQDTVQLKLEMEEAQYAISEAKILRNKAKREWERQKQLFDIKSASGKAYDDARFNYDASRKKVNRLRAIRKNLEDQLRKKQIRAPVSGYVVKRQCQIGQWLGEGNPAVTLVVQDPIRFMVPVPERYIPSIKEGDQASITFDALPAESFEGKIEAVIPMADSAARTFPVRIKISNPKGAIKPGMLGRATLPAGNPHKALLVPKDALVLSGNGKVVFVVIDKTARLVPVETGAAYGPLIEVKGDLKAGLKVVVRGNERLRPGQPVKIVPSTSPPKTSHGTGRPIT